MYNTYADDIYRYLFSYVHNSALAEDLTAETFTKAWANIDNFDFKQPRPWLYKIAKNTLTDYFRKKQPLPLDEDIEIIDNKQSVEDYVDNQLSQKRIATAMTKLPDDMKSVVSMRFLLGYSVKKTASSLELTEANVRVLQYRALKKLRGYLS